MKITTLCVAVAYAPAAAVLILGEVEPLTPIEMTCWASIWCGVGGAASAARKMRSRDVILRTALYMSVAGPAAMWGSYYWTARDGPLAWSVLGLVVFCSLGGYAAIDFVHGLLRKIGAGKVERFSQADRNGEDDPS